MTRLIVVLVVFAAACAEEPPEAPPVVETAPEPEPRPPWDGVSVEDGRVELRAGDAADWLVLRRLQGSGWIRGYAYGGSGEAVRLRRPTGRPRFLRSPLARVEQSRPMSRFRRFWTHAQVLRDLSGEAVPPSIAGVGVSRARLAAFVEGAGADVDGTLFEGVEAAWGEYAIVVETPRPGGPGSYCEARVSFPAGADHVVIGVREHVGGTGGNGTFAHCPDDTGWLEVGGRRIELDEESAGFYRRGARRGFDYPSCPSRMAASDLVRYARNRRLRLCSTSCCYDATDAFREAIGAASARLQTLSDLVAERPVASAFGPGPRGPAAAR